MSNSRKEDFVTNFDSMCKKFRDDPNITGAMIIGLVEGEENRESDADVIINDPTKLYGLFIALTRYQKIIVDNLISHIRTKFDEIFADPSKEQEDD